jgi:multiple sugar transport system permease protein
VLPSLLILLSIIIFPMAYSLVLSFYSYQLYSPTGTMSFVGLDNFFNVLWDPIFYNSLANMLIIISVALPVEFCVAFFLALTLYARLKEGIMSSFFKMVFMMPIALAPIVVGWLWRFMLWAKLGLADMLAEKIGFASVGWLTHPTTALLSIILVDIWEWTPFVFMIILSGLQALPEAPLEAAEVEGASGMDKIRYIVLPLMSPVMIVAVMFRLIQLVKYFDQVYILTEGGPGFSTYTISFYLFRLGLFRFEIGLASAGSQLVNVIVMVLIMITIRVMRGGSR